MTVLRECSNNCRLVMEGRHRSGKEEDGVENDGGKELQNFISYPLITPNGANIRAVKTGVEGN